MTQNADIKKIKKVEIPSPVKSYQKKNKSIIEIPLEEIAYFDTPLQIVRRMRMDEEALAELSLSIKVDGLIQPLVIRLNIDDEAIGGYKYILVAGERRHRASSLADLATVDCIVRDLTYEQAVDIQIHENLHREDVHPLDEAVSYKQLMDERGYNISDVAEQVGKSLEFVSKRLKLNDLIPEALADISKEILPLRHAKEIAKYTGEQQNFILDEIAYVYNDRDRGVEPFSKLCNEINRTLKLQLSLAPFDLKSTELLKSGLACINCPQRTGANPCLFGIEDMGEDDKCLNESCYDDKLTNHIKLQRKAIAEEQNIRGYKKTLVLTDSYTAPEEFPEAVSKGYAYEPNFKTIDSKEKACKHQEEAVWISSSKVGNRQHFCRNQNCSTHFKSSSNSSSGCKRESTPEELDLKRQRREELLDIKVCEPIREPVFQAKKEVYSADNWFFDNDQNLGEMVGKLFYYVRSDSNDRFDLTCKIMDFNQDKMKDKYDWIDRSKVIAFCQKLDKFQLSQLLFLTMRIHVGEMKEGHNYVSQKEIKKMANESDFDYKLADAENRLAFATKKYKDTFQDHYDKVKEGKRSKTPRIYSENYKQND